MAPISENTPSTAIPISRNGKSKIHTIGYKIIAIIARGQQRINKMSQIKNATIVKKFEFRPILCIRKTSKIDGHLLNYLSRGLNFHVCF